MMNDLIFVPPEVLMGEAGLCPILAMVAVAHVYQRNRRMNGWQPPDERAVWAALLWPLLPDPSLGASYVFSTADLAGSAARGIVGERPPRVVWECKVGSLAFY